MRYVYDYILDELRLHGLDQAARAKEDLNRLCTLLQENPDLPFCGCGYINDRHAQDGSVEPECSQLTRAVLGQSGWEKQIFLYDENASPKQMREVLKWTMRDLSDDEEAIAEDDNVVRDWYEHQIPWTDVVFCVFSSL